MKHLSAVSSLLRHSHALRSEETRQYPYPRTRALRYGRDVGLRGRLLVGDRVAHAQHEEQPGCQHGDDPEDPQ